VVLRFTNYGNLRGDFKIKPNREAIYKEIKGIGHPNLKSHKQNAQIFLEVKS
jgi:hypothetical protein